MSSYETGYIEFLSAVYALFLFVMVINGVMLVFAFIKDVQPIRGRNARLMVKRGKLLLGIQWFCLIGLVSYAFWFATTAGQEFTDGQCLTQIWVNSTTSPVKREETNSSPFQFDEFDTVFSTKYLANLIIAAYVLIIFVRCLRLLILFNITENRVRHEDEASNDTNISSVKSTTTDTWQPKRIWENPEIASTKNMAIVWLVLLLLFQVFPIALTIWGYTNPKFKDDFASVCDETVTRVSSVISIVLVLIGIAIVGIKLRKVHDGYFVKNEMKFVALTIIVLAIPLLIIAFITSWATSIVPIFGIAISTFQFTIPNLMAMKTIKSYTVTTKSSSDEERSFSSRESKPFDGFKEHPRVAKFLSQGKSVLEPLEEYMIHFQRIDMGQYFKFWNDIQSFKTNQNSIARTCRAWILYQKYIDPNAYIYIEGITPETRAELKHKITEAMKQEEERADKGIQGEHEGLDPGLFDEILEHVEDVLYEKLFVPFFHSRFYTKSIKNMAFKEQHEE